MSFLAETINSGSPDEAGSRHEHTNRISAIAFSADYRGAGLV